MANAILQKFYLQCFLYQEKLSLVCMVVPNIYSYINICTFCLIQIQITVKILLIEEHFNLLVNFLFLNFCYVIISLHP